MDKAEFELSLQKVLRDGHTYKGIGTLGEKTLHAVLKLYLEPDESKHEIKISSFVADIAGENGIMEIQTGSFGSIRKKLSNFLDFTTVTVAYPIAHTKWLVWIDPETGTATKKRKSPKRGSEYNAFYELYKIKQLLNHPNLRLRLLLIDMEEYRYLNGWSYDRKRGSSRYERIPTALVDEIMINAPEEYHKLIPPGLPEQFTSRDYMRSTGLSLRGAQTALHVLRHVGSVEHVGKQGKLYIYEAVNSERNSSAILPE